MDSQTLNAFIAVVDHGSFSEAAESLHLSQPAVSKRIHSLELQVGVTLLYRSSKKLALTEAGEIFQHSARTILREMENAKTSINNLSHSVTGKLKVISSHHIGLHRLPPAIKRFLNLYPEVDLTIEFMESEKAFEKILKNQADIAFMTTSNQSDRSAIIEHFYWNDPMNFVCSTGHPLSLEQSPNLKSLAAHTAILPEKKTFTYALLDELFKKHQLNLQVTIPTNYLETIKMLMDTGLGWTLLPNTMIDELVHVIGIPEISIERKLSAVSHKQHKMSNASLAFIDIAKSIWPD